MRKFYKEYFCIMPNGKISDKVMIVRTVMMIVVMVVALATMSMTAYAFFTYNITSGSNMIIAAHFEAGISVYEETVVQMESPDVQEESTEEEEATEQPADQEEVVDQEKVFDQEGAAEEKDSAEQETSVVQTISTFKANYSGSCQLSLEGGKTYKIVITPTANSTAQTGFCVITADNCEQKYHTKQLGVDGNEFTSELIFYLMPSVNTNVNIDSHWGTSSYYGYENQTQNVYIENDEKINLIINGVEIAETSVKETETEETETEETETEETETEEIETEESETEESEAEESVVEESIIEETESEESSSEETEAEQTETQETETEESITEEAVSEDVEVVVVVEEESISEELSAVEI